jgi:acetoin utilization protein AcuB
MFVKDWMSSPAVCVLPDVPVRLALGLMERRKVRRLPVVEGGALVGIVTLSDLLKVVNRSDGVPSGVDLPIERVMTKNPITVTTDDPLEVAARIMIRMRVSGLPVLLGGRVQGVITESDLFRAMAGIMGFGEHHGRVSMRLPDGERLFDLAERRWKGRQLRSFVTYYDDARNEWESILQSRDEETAASDVKRDAG